MYEFDFMGMTQEQAVDKARSILVRRLSKKMTFKVDSLQTALAITRIAMRLDRSVANRKMDGSFVVDVAMGGP